MFQYAKVSFLRLPWQPYSDTSHHLHPLTDPVNLSRQSRLTFIWTNKYFTIWSGRPLTRITQEASGGLFTLSDFAAWRRCCTPRRVLSSSLCFLFLLGKKWKCIANWGQWLGKSTDFVRPPPTSRLRASNNGAPRRVPGGYWRRTNHFVFTAAFSVMKSG